MKNPDPLNWAEVEREFDEKFPVPTYQEDSLNDTVFIPRGAFTKWKNGVSPALKTFLHDKLLEAEKRGRESAVDYIEKNSNEQVNVINSEEVAVSQKARNRDKALVVPRFILRAARESKGTESV